MKLVMVRPQARSKVQYLLVNPQLLLCRSQRRSREALKDPFLIGFLKVFLLTDAADHGHAHDYIECVAFYT